MHAYDQVFCNVTKWNPSEKEKVQEGLFCVIHTIFESTGGHGGGEWLCDVLCKDGKGLYGGGLWPKAKLKW